jgi:tetratricopeptide (TPR) repeat protein
MVPNKLTIRESKKYSQVHDVPTDPAAGLVGKLTAALLLLIIIWSFLPVLQNGFIDWDERTLVNNPDYRGLGLAELRWMFGDFHFGQYQPLAWITFALDYLLWWMDPFGYHLTSLLLHAACAIVFYFVTLRLLALGQLGLAVLPHMSLRATAGLAALVFAIHPLRVEPVAWAFGRGEIVSALFFLWSILFYLRAAALTEHNRRWLCCMAASIAAFGLSLLARAGAIALPLVLLILDVYPLRRLGSPLLWFRREFRRLWLEKTPYFVFATAAVVIMFVARNEIDEANATSDYSVATRIIHMLVAPAFYLWKTILPLGLSPLYELRALFLMVGGLVVVAITVGLFLERRRWPALVATWTCHLALVLPSISSDLSGQQLIADRYTYLSGFPWAVLIGTATVLHWSRWLSGRETRWTVLLGSGLPVLILISLGTLTWTQTHIWRDSETLWRNAAVNGGSSEAHNRLAALLESQGKYDEAIASYRRVVGIDPQRWDAHEKAALLLQKQGKISEAVEHFRSAVQINPAATEARNNLAAGLVNQGETTEAVEHFRKVLELAPERNETRLKLGTILAVQGRIVEAIDLFQQAVRAEPADAKGFVKLGQALAAQGNLDEAIISFREALRIQPEDAEVHENLGRALVEQGKREEAARHLREALRILKSSPVSR